jgi:hypothetical protein
MTLVRALRDAMLARTQDFGENENQNHSDEQPGLLGSSSHTGVTNNTDGETSSHTRKTNRETGTELDEAGEEGSLLLQTVGDQDGDDETVDTDNTSHDDGDNVCAGLAMSRLQTVLFMPQRSAEDARRTLDDQVRTEDTHGADTDTSLGSTVGGTEAGKDDG